MDVHKKPKVNDMTWLFVSITVFVVFVGITGVASDPAAAALRAPPAASAAAMRTRCSMPPES